MSPTEQIPVFHAVNCRYALEDETFVAERRLRELRLQIPAFLIGAAGAGWLIALRFVDRAPTFCIPIMTILTALYCYRVYWWSRFDPAKGDIVEKRAALSGSRRKAIIISFSTLYTVFFLDRLATPDEQLLLLLYASYIGFGGGLAYSAVRNVSWWLQGGVVGPYGVYLISTGEPIAKLIAFMCVTSVAVSSLQCLRISRIIAELTEQRARAHRLSRHTEETFRDFMEMASDWAWETDSDHRLSYVSPGAEDVFGRKPGDLIGLTPLEALRAGKIKLLDDRAEHLINTARFQRHDVKDFQLETLDRNSRYRIFSTTIRHYFDEDAEYRGVRGWTTDITEKIESQRSIERANARLEADIAERTRELRAREDLLDKVLDTMTNGIAAVDAEFRVKEVNRKAIAMSGLPEKAWEVGADIRRLAAIGIENGAYDATTLDEYLANIRSQIAQAGTSIAERRLPNGSTTLEQVRPMEDGGYVVTYVDVTEDRRRETELRQLSEELMRAKEEAVNANLAKSQFLANMSHEIRTPMNGVVGMASLLLHTPLTAKQREMARVIESSGENLLTVINDILDFSRLEAGKLKIVSEPFDLRAAIGDVAALLALRAQVKGVDLLVRFPPALPTRYIGDIGRIRQIVTNLVGNAVKFTEQGHVVIEVSHCANQTEGGVEIAVSDTGCGIPPDKLAHIFNAFEQVDGTAARRYDGAGLGLAITRRLVEGMGGDISLESEVGRGSRFVARLPLPTVPAAPKPNLDVPAIRGAKLLIIDDNSVSREIHIEQLSAFGLDPVAFPSGPEAIEAAAQAAEEGSPFAGALIDEEMPCMDAQTIARRLRGLPGAAGMPVILLTSTVAEVENDGSRIDPFDARVIKPPRIEPLIDALTTSLKTCGAQINGGAAASAAPAPRANDPSTLFTDDDRPLRLLVAEDNIVNQLVIKSMLESLGCQVSIANNGREAVDCYTGADTDIVLMDLSMPEMDGIEATKRLREIQAQESDRPPIIGVTAHALKDDRIRCLNAGMDDCLTKPVKSAILQEALVRWSPRLDEETRAARLAKLRATKPQARASA
ncbi:MAG: response regulator [Pseudomonadota bacterium]